MSKKPVIDFVWYGDWTALYVNGKLYDEGPGLKAGVLCEALGVEYKAHNGEKDKKGKPIVTTTLGAKNIVKSKKA